MGRQWNWCQWTLTQIGAWTPEQLLTQLPHLVLIYPRAVIFDLLNNILTPEAFNALLPRPFMREALEFWESHAPTLSRERIESILPSTIREIRYRGFFEALTPQQLHWLSSTQLSALPDSIFTSRNPNPEALDDTVLQLSHFMPSQLPYLNSEIFIRISANQLNRLSEAQIRSLTKEQLQKIPAQTFRRMGREELARFYRSFTEEQRNHLTPEQRAVFAQFLEGTEKSGHLNGSPPPPPPSAGGGGGGGSGGGAGSAGGAAGGARPKAWSFIARWMCLSPGSGKRKEHAPFLPLEYLREAPAEFWNKHAGPEMQIRTVSYTTQGLPIVEVTPINLEKYQEWIRALSRDQIQAIPPSVISQLEWFVLEAFNAKQIRWMTLEQRKACTTRFIKIEPELRKLLGISKNQMLTINGKQISSNQTLVPEDCEALIDQVDGRQIQQRFSPEKIRNLSKNPNSFLLPFFKPHHIISIGSHDLNSTQIQAFGKEIITEIWDSDYFNTLVPDQRKGILPYIAEIDPAVIAKWEAQCFDYPGENPILQQNYRDQVRQFTQEQITSIAPKVLALLGPRFFSDYLSPQQVRMLKKEQLQAISENTLKQLPETWFYNLMEEKEAGKWNTQWLNSLRENQVKAIPLTFFSKFGEKVGKRIALQFLEGLWRSQVQAISKEQLDALSAEDFSLLPMDFLNKLSDSQIKTRTPDQIAALGILAISALQEDFIAALTTDQIKKLTPQQVNALGKNQIRALDNKVSSFQPSVYLNSTIVNNLLLYGTMWQLNFLSGEQEADLTKISVQDFGQASAEKGKTFVNFFKKQLIASQNSKYRNVISNELYAQLIREIHNGLTDEECKKLGINMSLAEYRIGVKAFVETLETSEGMLTDEERRAIFLGIYRIRITKDHAVQTIVSALNRNEKPYSVETQVSLPPVERRIPDVANNSQLPVPKSDNGLALSNTHIRTDL